MPRTPPLAERIRRIQPYWDGKFVNEESVPEKAPSEPVEHSEKTKAGVITAATVLAGAIDAVNRAGFPTAEQAIQSKKILDELPQDLLRSSRETYDARAVIYSLLLDADAEVADRQLFQLIETSDNITLHHTKSLAEKVSELPAKQRLPLIDIALPALRQLSVRQYKEFKDNLDALINADKRVTLFEWSLYQIVVHNLEDHFLPSARLIGNNKEIHHLYHECSILFSYLSRATPNTDEQHAFRAAVHELGSDKVKLLPEGTVSIDALNLAVSKLARLKPLNKPGLLKACAACIAADEKVTAREMELFRALSAVLDCPLPPLPEDLPYTNR